MQIKFFEMIKITTDGTTTLYSDCFKTYYHSIFGARQESERVFMELGLDFAFEHFAEIRILEMGFGTGLNALLASERAVLNSKKVNYTGLEAFPISKEEVSELNFNVLPFHEATWGLTTAINPFFDFRKINTGLEDFQLNEKFNLVFYDAFAPSAQPELWTAEIFQHLASFLDSGAVLTTYCSKVYVQKNLKAAGFRIEKHAGPYRKREVLRAILS